MDRDSARSWAVIDGFCIKKLVAGDGRVVGYKVWPSGRPHQAERVPLISTARDAIRVYRRRHGMIQSGGEGFGGLRDLVG